MGIFFFFNFCPRIGNARSISPPSRDNSSKEEMGGRVGKGWHKSMSEWQSQLGTSQIIHGALNPTRTFAKIQKIVCLWKAKSKEGGWVRRGLKIKQFPAPPLPSPSLPTPHTQRKAKAKGADPSCWKRRRPRLAPTDSLWKKITFSDPPHPLPLPPSTAPPIHPRRTKSEKVVSPIKTTEKRSRPDLMTNPATRFLSKKKNWLNSDKKRGVVGGGDAPLENRIPSIFNSVLLLRFKKRRRKLW